VAVCGDYNSAKLLQVEEVDLIVSRWSTTTTLASRHAVSNFVIKSVKNHLKGNEKYIESDVYITNLFVQSYQKLNLLKELQKRSAARFGCTCKNFRHSGHSDPKLFFIPKHHIPFENHDREFLQCNLTRFPLGNAKV
jgi:hypothetical protein